MEDSLPFDRYGTGSPCVLVLHGLGGNRNSVHSFLRVEELACSTISVDLRAHGESLLDEQSGCLTFSQLAIDVEDFVHRHSIQPEELVLVGISMGAGIICEILARHVIMPRAAVLLRPAWLWAPNPDHLDIYKHLSRILEAKTPARARDVLFTSRQFEKLQRNCSGCADSVVAQLDDPKAKTRAHRLRVIPASAPRRPDTHFLPGALAVVAIEGDPIHPSILARELAAEIGATCLVVPSRYSDPEGYRSAVTRTIVSLSG